MEDHQQQGWAWLLGSGVPTESGGDGPVRVIVSLSLSTILHSVRRSGF